MVILRLIEVLSVGMMTVTVVFGILLVMVSNPSKFSVHISVLGHFSIIWDSCSLDFILIIGVDGLLLRKFSDLLYFSLSETFVKVNL